MSEAEVTDIVEAKEAVYEFNSSLETGEIKQVDWENEGAKIAVKRVVVKDNQVVIEDTIRTTYQPWGSVYEFGPEAKLPEGAVIIEPKEDVENDISTRLPWFYWL